MLMAISPHNLTKCSTYSDNRIGTVFGNLLKIHNCGID